MHRIRRAMSQCLVRPLAVVERKVFCQPNQQFPHRGVAIEVHVLMLDAAPQALDGSGVWCTLARSGCGGGDGDGCSRLGSGRRCCGGRCGFCGGRWGPDGAGSCESGYWRRRERRAGCDGHGQRGEIGLPGRRRRIGRWRHARGRCGPRQRRAQRHQCREPARRIRRQGGRRRGSELHCRCGCACRSQARSRWVCSHCASG